MVMNCSNKWNEIIRQMASYFRRQFKNYRDYVFYNAYHILKTDVMPFGTLATSIK